MGNICFGSILIPVLGVIRGSARAVSLASGDVDEFMFSCANCCSGVASRIVAYGNRWGFVHVGVYNKRIVQASMDTWEMFKTAGMEKLIDSDLTSSFCFLSGVAAGSVCALLGGTWAIVIHMNYATEVCIYAFLTGYLTNRVAMAWVQASIMAYYVAYAENPQSQQFGNAIPAYIQELQRSLV
ncbi:Plasma-membrane choline transporter family protein [Salvia divinorum]|uniref:Choline transporter-like protein n=1 Tax=Salvia divinorum TaxID=28513 RepID=A0ABD1FGX9_SALDI